MATRVSTDGQTLDAQVAQLKAAGADNPSRSAHADGAGGLSRVRARADPRTHGRGARACQRARSAPWTKAEAHTPLAARGSGPPRCRRAVDRNRSLLRRASLDHLTACAAGASLDREAFQWPKPELLRRNGTRLSFFSRAFDRLPPTPS